MQAAELYPMISMVIWPIKRKYRIDYTKTESLKRYVQVYLDSSIKQMKYDEFRELCEHARVWVTIG